MPVSKVVYGGNNLIDLTGDTVTSDKLHQNYTAHGADGSLVTGSFTLDSEITTQNSLISQIYEALIGKTLPNSVNVKIITETKTITESKTYLNANYETSDYTKIVFIGMFYDGNSNYQEGRKVDCLLSNVAYLDSSTGEAYYTTTITGNDEATVTSNGTQTCWHYKVTGATYLEGAGTYGPKVFTSGVIRLGSASTIPNFMNVGDTYKCIIGEII